MLRSSSKRRTGLRKFVVYGLGLPAWVFLGFMLAQAIIIALLNVFEALGGSFGGVNDAALNTALSAVIYLLAVALVIGVPWLVKGRKTTMEDLGLQRLVDWLDMLWAPAGYIVYAVGSTLLLWFISTVLPMIDLMQEQETGFTGITQGFEYTLAFLSLVVIAPVAEEVLFRGYLFGKLRKRFSLWLSIILTSLLFAIVHFAWNVGFDVFVLSIVLCLLRVMTGSLWAPILLHMIKNGIAFYFIFVNTTLLF